MSKTSNRASSEKDNSSSVCRVYSKIARAWFSDGACRAGGERLVSVCHAKSFSGVAIVARGQYEEPRRTHLLDVIIGYQAYGLILIFSDSLLLGLPPPVVVILFDDIKQVAFAQGQFTSCLGCIVIKGSIDAEESHIAVVP